MGSRLRTLPTRNERLIVTTIGGVSLGEICHRLYPARRVGIPSPPLSADGRPYRPRVLDDRPLAGTDNLTNALAAGRRGVAIARRYEDGASEGRTREIPPRRARITIVYGDPSPTKRPSPFTQFDLDLAAGLHTTSSTPR
jgi:hypothetical protein